MTASFPASPVTGVTCSRCGGAAGQCVCDVTITDAGDADLISRLSEALGAQYVVVRRLAQGGFSDVFEICDIELDRRLAVKVLRPDVAWTHGMRARFKQEARAIARLNHPGTVPIHFVGEADGLVFYVMSFVEGSTLADLLVAQGPLDALLVAQLVIPVLEALEHAHSLGIVHRDIKPDNVLLETASGRPLLVDFGIAKCLDGVATHTQAGFVVGTPLYMSPEQALGRDTVDARADLYAFGAMVFQLLTGAPPFDGKTSQEIVGKHLSHPVPVPSHLNARIPKWMSDVIVRCMAKDPADRFPSAGHVVEALRAGLATAPADKVTAARIVARIETGLRSPVVLAAPITPAGPSPTQPTRVAAPVRRLPRWTAIPAALAAGAALWLAFGRGAGSASLVIDNQLMSPVWVTQGRRPAQLVQPGDSMRLEVPAGEALAADWAMVRPVSAAGKPMGEVLRGNIRIDDPQGSLHRSIDLAAAGGSWFAPHITNTSGMVLTVGVASASGDWLCDCEVAAGDAPVWLGYYQLSDDAEVRVRDKAGRQARYNGFRARVDARGDAAIQVDKRDFPVAVAVTPRPQTRSQAYAAKAPPPKVVEEPILQPVAVIELPPAPAPEPVPVAEAAPPPAPKPARRASTPSFLPN